MKVVTFSILCFTSVILADDFKTNDGKEYKNAAVSRVEPDGIVITTNSGISKLYFTELPRDVQERFQYDPERAATYVSQQADAYAKQQSLAQAAQAAEERNKHWKDAVVEHQQAQAAAKQAKQGAISGFVARLQELQQQEDELLARLAHAKQAQKAASRIRKRNPGYSDPSELEIPLLRSHLNDVRHDKNEAKRQLERAQRR